MNNHDVQKPSIEPLDKANLYLAQIVADRVHGELKVLTPINVDMTPDNSRAPKFFSMIVVTLPIGPIQHEFEIVADSLEAALDAYADAANQAGIDFIQGAKDAALRNSILGAKN